MNETDKEPLDIVERITKEFNEQGGLGLVPDGYIIEYDNINDTYIYSRNLDINNVTGEYMD